MKPTVAEVGPLVRALTQERISCTRKTGLVGGHLHIVLSDYNFEDENIQWCVGEAATNGCEICGLIGEKMLLMSRKQRKRLSEIHGE